MNCCESNHDQNTSNNENKSLFTKNQHEHQELDDFPNVCRICATIADQLCPIFDEQSLRDDLARKINKYLPNKVSKEDGLPQVICVQCQSTILAWDELVKCSVQANMVLQQKLSVMRLLDPDKTEEKKVTTTETPIETKAQTFFNFNDIVREVLTDYFNELNIEEEHADLEYVCQFCADSPTSKSIKELTDHLMLIHITKLRTKQSIEDFVKDNIAFEEVLIIEDKDDRNVESAHNELESVINTKEIKLQNYCCPFCKSVFSSPCRLVCHLNKHIEISIANGIVCCEQLYENKFAFVAHLQDVHVSRIFDENTCKSCGKVSCDFEELLAHINEEHPESKDFNEPKKPVHIATRQKYIPVVCPKCNKTFSNKYNLRVHMRSHKGEQTTFKCNKCNKSYKSQGSLNYHHKIYHEGILEYLCSLCGEAFPSRETRNVHARIHTGATPFKCYQCGKSYRAKNTLDRHMDMHLDIRNYACSLCPKKFRKRTHLNYHLRTHEKKCNILIEQK